jgi:uncharacterized repeat protein (TIGR02059 family)
MSQLHFKKSRFSIFRAGLAGLVLLATCVVSVGTQSSVVRADAGEAPFGTPTQALQSAISLGGAHTCVIKDGNLLCWGDNTNGQLGNGLTGSYSPTPVYVKDSQANSGSRLSGVVSVVAAESHTCALLNSGKVKCWGYQGYGATSVWQQYGNSGWPTFVKSAYTDATTYASSPDLTNVVSITAGIYGTCSLLADGRVKCWGQSGGKEGEGVGFVTECADTDITKACDFTTGVPISGIKQINMSGQYACGIKDDAEEAMYCWGDNRSGTFANGVQNHATMYPQKAGSSIFRAKALGTGAQSGCGLFQNGSNVLATTGGVVKCWGLNGSGSLGNGGAINEPNAGYSATNVVGITNAITIAGGLSSYCSLLIDETVKCWGPNNDNMFANTTTGNVTTTPVQMLSGGVGSPTLTGVSAVSLGSSHLCLIMKLDGSVKCIGANSRGQLGDGTVTTRGVVTGVNGGEAGGGAGGLIGAGADNSAPVYSTSAVSADGAKIVMTYLEPISASGLPPTSAFTVKVNDVVRTVSSINVDGSTVEVMLAQRIGPGATVKLSYTDPSLIDDANAIQDVSFNDGGTLSERVITNSSTADIVTPTLVSGAVNAAGNKLVLTYNEALGGTVPLASSFTVLVAGSARIPTGLAFAGSTIELTFSPVIQQGQTVTVAYTAPASGLATTNAAIQDLQGNDAASFADTAITVTNGSTVDVTAPTLVSRVINSDGTKIILTYNETLGTTVPAGSAFAVLVAGSARTVSSVARGTTDTSTIELTLASAVTAGQAVTMGYTAPAVNVATSNAAIQDTSGNDAAAITAGSSVSNLDVVNPTLVSGAVNSAGTKLVLTYDEALHATTAATSAFAVTVGGSSRAVSSVAVVGSTVELTLSSIVGTGQAVTVAYTAPASNTATSNSAIQDTTGNDAATFASSALTVTNSSTADITAPTVVSRAVNAAGTKVILTYSEALNATTAASSAFVVTVDGVSRVVSSVTVVGSTVELTLASVVDSGQTVTVAYTAPTADSGTSNSAMQDSAGNDVASFTAASQSVTNGSTMDTTGPTLVSRAVNAAGTKVILTYNEALNATTAASSAFAVTVAGSSRTVSSVAVVGSTVELTLASVVERNHAVTVAYTAPASNTATSNLAVQDTIGNDAGSFTAASQSVSNVSTHDTIIPTLVSGAVDSGGSTLTLTMSEEMASSTATTTTFTVTVDGVQVTVTGITVSGNEVILTLSPAIKTGQTVAITYNDPTSGNDANAVQDSIGNDIPSFGPVAVTNTSSQPATPVAPVTPVTPVTPAQVVDGDASVNVTLATQTVAGKSGKAKFADGSTFDVGKNGNLIPKLFTAYIGYVTGSVKVSYLSGKKTVSTTCSYGRYGSIKPKKVSKVAGGFYPKVFISPKKSCVLSKAALKALNTGLVTISAKLRFARLWPTTGKPKNPESGAAVNPVNRSYTVKIGTSPK